MDDINPQNADNVNPQPQDVASSSMPVPITPAQPPASAEANAPTDSAVLPAAEGLGQPPERAPQMLPAPTPDPVPAVPSDLFPLSSPPTGSLPPPPPGHPATLPAPDPRTRSMLPPPPAVGTAPAAAPMQQPAMSLPAAPLGPVQLPLHGPDGYAAPGPVIEHPLAPKSSRAPASRKGLVLMGVFATLLGLGLLATGYAFAVATDDDPSNQTAATGGALVVAPPPENNIVAPPIIADSGEPVAAVASKVLPSVVLINTGIGQGSGIVYNDTLIVTNAHVVGEASEVDVQLANGSILDGTVLGTDPGRDIAVVQVAAGSGLTPAVFAPSETVEVGQLAVALGSPFGLDQTVTSGVVSAVGRVIPAGLTGENLVAMVQTDAPINPGNSGGALADRQGLIIGMNTAIRTETGTFSGVGFAIPSDTILLIVERIVAGESLETGFLGVGLDNSTTGTVGALITDVVDGSPADLAGIRAGDVVIKIGGQTVEDRSDLAAAIRLRSPGAEIELEVVRDGEPFNTTVTLGES